MLAACGGVGMDISRPARQRTKSAFDVGTEEEGEPEPEPEPVSRRPATPSPAWPSPASEPPLLSSKPEPQRPESSAGGRERSGAGAVALWRLEQRDSSAGHSRPQEARQGKLRAG